MEHNYICRPNILHACSLILPTMLVMSTDKQKVMFTLYSLSVGKINLFKGLCVGLNDNVPIWIMTQCSTIPSGVHPW